MAIRSARDLEDVYFEMPAREGAGFDVVGLGSNAVDWILRVPHFPEHAGKLRLRSRNRLAGGQIATAVALWARWGLRTRYVGRVGDDDGGRFLLETLATDPVDLSYLEVIPETASQTAFVLVDDEGERTILWQRDPRLYHRPEELPSEAIQSGRVLHMDGYNLTGCVQAARVARAAGMKVSLDVDRIQPGVEELLALTDFLIPTLNFVRGYTGEEAPQAALLRLDETVPALLVATDGSRGCLVVWQKQVFRIPGFSVTPVDTTGAGDVFHAAFVFSLLQNRSLAECLRFSNAAAAISTTRPGSRGGIPERSEIEKLRQTYRRVPGPTSDNQY